MAVGKANEVQGGKMLGVLANVSPKQQGSGAGGGSEAVRQ
jgi:hypothetical protein